MRRSSAPKTYPLTEEDLDDIVRGAPDTSVSTPFAVLAVVVTLAIWFFS
jgi:hypothetical protein